VSEALVSVVLVNRNTRDYLRASLEALHRIGAESPLECIVVDNASTDGSVAMVAQDFPDVVVIPNATNIGFAPACNQAWERSRGDLVLIQNPDVSLTRDAFNRMVAFLFTEPYAGIVGARLLNADGSAQEGGGGQFLSLTRTLTYALGVDQLRRRAGHSTLFHINATGPLAVDWVSGACMLVRREVLIDVKGFDANFFLYFEDMDLCFRARTKGWLTYFHPDAAVVHQRGASSLQKGSGMAPRLVDSLQLFCRKHRPFGHQLIRPLLALAFFLRLPVNGLRFLVRPSPASRRQVQLTAVVFAALVARHP
jgi:GT2 family glycosyltransferase